MAFRYVSLSNIGPERNASRLHLVSGTLKGWMAKLITGGFVRKGEILQEQQQQIERFQMLAQDQHFYLEGWGMVEG